MKCIVQRIMLATLLHRPHKDRPQQVPVKSIKPQESEVQMTDLCVDLWVWVICTYDSLSECLVSIWDSYSCRYFGRFLFRLASYQNIAKILNVLVKIAYSSTPYAL